MRRYDFNWEEYGPKGAPKGSEWGRREGEMG